MKDCELKEILSKFENGEERYKTSSILNVTVRALLSGAEPISIIDQLIQMNEDNLKRFEEYVKTDYRPILIQKETTQ